jgi:hypothetical protein
MTLTPEHADRVAAHRGQDGPDIIGVVVRTRIRELALSELSRGIRGSEIYRGAQGSIHVEWRGLVLVGNFPVRSLMQETES